MSRGGYDNHGTAKLRVRMPLHEALGLAELLPDPYDLKYSAPDRGQQKYQERDNIADP